MTPTTGAPANPIVREAFFPTTEHLYSVVGAKPDDGRAIASIIERYEPVAAGAVLGAWWRRVPGAFRVVRDRLGAVAGFYILTEMDRLSHGLVEDDPVARQYWDHLRRHPVARSQHGLCCRVVLARDYGDAPSPVQAACWLDLKRTYMELRPHLRRIYSTVRDVATYGPMAAPLGFESLPGEPIAFDGVPYYTALNDFGPIRRGKQRDRGERAVAPSEAG